MARAILVGRDVKRMLMQSHIIWGFTHEYQQALSGHRFTVSSVDGHQGELGILRMRRNPEQAD
jgi:hypothetical protein